MTAVTELGYVRFGVSSLEEWRAFATDLVGLEIGDDSEPGRLYLRSDLWHHRIALEENGADDLIGAGLRVAGPAEFTAMQAHLSELGVPYEVAGDDVARDRHVLELLTLSDPAGIPLEIFHGPQVEAHRPFHPGRPMFSRFVTGDGGVGHVLVNHAGLEATYDFYRNLGMRGSLEYRMPMPDGSTAEFLFMHANSRDHTFAFGVPTDGKHIHHLMLEVDHLDDVLLAHGIVSKSQYPITVPLGRHANDQTFSFYFKGPSGFQVEIGWGGRPATHQSEYYTRDTYRGSR